MAYKKVADESGDVREYYLDFCTEDEDLIVWGLPDDKGPYGCFDAKKVYEFLKEIYG